MNQSFFSHVVHLSKWGQRIVLMAVLLAAVLVFSAFSFAPAAHAAPSTRAAAAIPAAGAYAQIGVVSYGWSVWIDGYNQNGNLVTHCLNIPTTPPQGSVLANWWWNGVIGVGLIFYHNTTGYNSPYNCPAGDPNRTACFVTFDNVGNTAWFNDIGRTCNVGQ